jgi:hypothetical protein
MGKRKSLRLVALLSAVVCLTLLALQSALAQEHATLKSYPTDTFSAGWTHIVSTPNGLLYYNAQTGAGALGQLDGAGTPTTLKSYPAGTFSAGWTHIVSTPNGLLYYNAQTGAGAVGRVN